MIDGIEYAILAYLTSDKKELDVCIKLSTSNHLPTLKPDAIQNSRELIGFADDWRAMTREEIEEYKLDNAS